MTEESLFHETLARPVVDRAAYLDAACAGRPELRAAVEALLAAHAASRHPLDATVDSAAATLGFTASLTAAQPVGAVIAGRYTLVEKLGEGGMGEVWVAQQTEPVKRRVALKLIKGGMDSASVLARFEQERQALALMDHPNIARVLDGGVTPRGQPFFVMELVEGQPLTAFCDGAKLGLRARLELFVTICQAVQHAHQKGIVHRDLKPANILVTLVDGRPVPKVIDFGVAKATGGGLTDTELQTQAGAVVGTLDYMAPEQAGAIGEDIDTRADVYSLGVILYELLTSTRPLDSQRMKGANLLEILRAIREEEPSRPSTRVAPAQAKALAGELDWIAMRCLEKDRARRYQSASDLARDVQRYLADEPVEARPPSFGYRLRKYLQRNRTAVAMSAVVVVSLVVGLGVAIWQAVVATEARNDAQRAEGQERQAKDRAFQLANDNARLADDANAANRETRKQFQRNRIVLFNSQMERVAQVRESNPDLALQYLFDVEACPLDLRDLAWRWVERSESRRRLFSLMVQFSSAIPTSERVALSGDGSRLATAYSATAPRPQLAIGTVTLYDRRTDQVTGTLPDFARTIGHLAISPDGRTLAVVADDLPYQPRGPGVVQLWDATTLRKLASLEGHAGPIEALAFSPDGTLLASASEDATARLWNVKNVTHLHTFEGHDKPLSALAFDRTGQRLATGGRDGSLRLWDVANRTAGPTFEVGTKPNPSVQSVDFHPDGTAVVLSDGNGQVGIRDLPDGKLRRMIALPVPAKRVYFHGDGGSLLIQESGVTRWDANTGTRLATEVEFPAMPALPGVPRVAPTWAVCYAWQSGILAAQIGPRCEVVAVGRPPELASWTLEKSTGYAPRAVLDGSGQVLAVTRGNKILLCDPRTGAVRHTLAGHLYLVGGLAISPDGRTLASSSVFQGLHPQGVATPHDSIRLWDILTGESLGQLQLPDYRVPAIAFSPDGSSLAALVHDVDFEFQAGVRVFDLKTRTQRLQLKHDHERTTEPLTPRLVYHPSGDRLVSVFERIAYVWNLTTGELERKLMHGLPAAKTQIGALAISPDGKTLVVARQEALSTELQEWELATGTMTRRTRPGPDMVVTGMVFSSDGKNLLTSGNGMLWIRDAATMKVRTSAVVHGRWEVALAFGPGARTLVTAGTKESVSSNANVDLIQTTAEVKLWDVGPTPTRLILPRRVYQGSMRFDPTGTRVIESDQSGWLRLWDVEKAELLAEFDGTRDSIGTLFSPDGRTLIGADTSGNLTLWDIESRSLRRVAFARGTPGRPAVSRDGSRVAILTGGPTSLPTLWVVDLKGDRPAQSFDFRTVRVPGQPRLDVTNEPFPNGVPLFSPDGQTVAVAANSGQILLVDLKAGAMLAPLRPGATRMLTVLEFTSDGRRLIVRRGPDPARHTIWDWREAQRVDEPIPPVANHPDLSPDGRYELRTLSYGTVIVERDQQREGKP